MKTDALTSRGIRLRMRHLPNCHTFEIEVFYGVRGDWVARCNRCAERRAVTPGELAAIREQLAKSVSLRMPGRRRPASGCRSRGHRG